MRMTGIIDINVRLIRHQSRDRNTKIKVQLQTTQKQKQVKK